MPKFLKTSLDKNATLVQKGTHIVNPIFAEDHPLGALNGKCLTKLSIPELEQFSTLIVTELQHIMACLTGLLMPTQTKLTDEEITLIAAELAVTATFQESLSQILHIRRESMCPDGVDITEHLRQNENKSFVLGLGVKEDGTPIIN